MMDSSHGDFTLALFSQFMDLFLLATICLCDKIYSHINCRARIVLQFLMVKKNIILVVFGLFWKFTPMYRTTILQQLLKWFFKTNTFFWTYWTLLKMYSHVTYFMFLKHFSCIYWPLLQIVMSTVNFKKFKISKNKILFRIK